MNSKWVGLLGKLGGAIALYYAFRVGKTYYDAYKNYTPPSDGSGSKPSILPGLNAAGFWGFWLPLSAGVLTLFPVPVPRRKMIGAVAMAAWGGDQVYQSYSTSGLSFSQDALVYAWAPAVAGAVTVGKLYSLI